MSFCRCSMLLLAVPVDNSNRAGTIGGTLLVVVLRIGSGEVLKTMVLAAVGATVSFCVSLALKFCVQRIRGR